MAEPDDSRAADAKEAYDNPLERLELLAGDDAAIARFLDAIDVSGPRERQMLSELARTGTLARPDEFEQAQEILGRPTRTHFARRVFAYAGLLTCGLCGRKLIPEEHVKRSGKRFVYYRCRGRTNGQPCPNPCLPEAAFERNCPPRSKVALP